MHACDINAPNKLDLVLAQSSYPNPYYMGKRKNLFVLGLNCNPEPQCFCRSMGTDSASQGFDLFLPDLGRKDLARYKHVAKEKSMRSTASVDTSDLTKILDLEFESKAREYWGERCLPLLP